jgi:N-acetylmuramoyl-L-alanine amidase
MRRGTSGIAGTLLAGMLLLGGCGGEQPALADRAVTVVVDPGHGGFDHGSSGTRTGVHEDELNLQVAQRLEKALEDEGFTVVMTRESSEIAYDSGCGLSKKTQDMRRRSQIIDEAGPDLVISIHMNKYPDGRYGGPQVFYMQGSERGRSLAESVQAQFNDRISGSGRSALASDYYILRTSAAPSILVECGFLSNATDEARLQTEDYQQQLAELIRDGVLAWLEKNQIDQ